MAQRRMFSKEITSCDSFIDMPVSAQLLYFHLGMEADSKGHIYNAKALYRAYSLSETDLSILIYKNFVFAAEKSITIIMDWKDYTDYQNER